MISRNFSAVPLDDLDIDAACGIFERQAGSFGQFHGQADRLTHAGRPDDWDRPCRIAQPLPLFLAQPCRPRSVSRLVDGHVG
jgi:hypothetical protein